MIPGNYFYYWTGQGFQFVHYLSVLSLLRRSRVERLEVHVEEAPDANRHWNEMQALDGVAVRTADLRRLSRLAGFEYEEFEPFLARAGTNHRSDLIRYLLLAAHGGVYLDFDTIVLKDLTPLLDVEFFVGRQRADVWGNDVNGAVMGSVRGSGGITRCIERARNVRRKGVPRSLGDLEAIVNRWLLPNRLRWAEAGPALLSRVVRADDFTGTVYPVEYFQCWHHGCWQEIFRPGLLDERAYVIHYFGSRSVEETRGLDERSIWRHDSVYADAARAVLRSDQERRGS